MKQTLQLRLSQQLAMTPQLQQAIRMLQLSSMELQAEIQEALDSNLMLELEGDDSDASGSEANVSPLDFPQELPVDTDWEDVYDHGPINSRPSNGDGYGADPASHRAQTETLKDRLHWQLSMMRSSESDRVIGAAIIDAVDDDGYLALSLEDIRQSLDPWGEELTLAEIEAVLRQIQNFDPPGVAARGLDECLVLQLRQLPEETERRDVALALVREHLHVLASKNYAQLMKTYGLGKDDLQGVIDLVRSLSPRPGSAIASGTTEYIVPDVFVRKERGVWKVELNHDTSPRLRVNTGYASLIRRADDSAENSTLKSHLQEARWLIKSLRSRSETLLRAATCIVERQRAFLEHGEEAMKPMVLADVAAAIGMHESTISRVTTRKYMHTPRGIFELKYFFSSHVRTASGSEASSTAIRAVLRKLIEAENPARPLSDHKLAKTLSGQGIRIARRTVAKYREAMAIPCSTERKAL